MSEKNIHCTLTDKELAAKADQWIDELIASGGKSWTMHVPFRPNADPDLIFAELNNRFKKLIKQPSAAWVKASDRLPGWRTPVKWRLKGVEMKKYDVAYISQAESPAHWMDLEWLDESVTYSESPAEQPVREVEFADLKRKGESLALELRRCIGTMIVHPDYQPNSEFRDRIDSANDALNEWSGEKEREP